MPASVPTGFSRFLSGLALLMVGAGVALMAVNQALGGVGVLVSGVLLWAISYLFRSKPFLPKDLGSSSYEGLDRPSPGHLQKPGVPASVPATSAETLNRPQGWNSAEEVEQAHEPTEEELWEEAADFLSAQALLGWKDPAGVLDELKGWRAKGVNIHAEGEDDLTLFDRACVEGAPVEVLEALASLGVHPRCHGYALDRVLLDAEPPAEHVVRYLLAQGANPNGNPRQEGAEPNAELDESSLVEICVVRELDDGILQALLAAGASDVWCEAHDESLLSLAIYNERPLSTVALLAQAFDVNAFHGAALCRTIEETRSVELVELLSGFGADPFLRDEDDETSPARLLIENEQWEEVKILAEHQNPDRRNWLVGMADALAASESVQMLKDWVELVGGAEYKWSVAKRSGLPDVNLPEGEQAALQAIVGGQLIAAVRALEYESEVSDRVFAAVLDVEKRQIVETMVKRRRRRIFRMGNLMGDTLG